MKNNNFWSPDSVSGKNNNWITVCKMFANNDTFLTFRSHPTMCRIVEGSPTRVGEWHLRRLKKNSNFHHFVDKFSTSDTVGSPKNLIKFISQERNIKMNPTTIRYINNIMNIIELFGLNIFSAQPYNKKAGAIVEIGAGYGGECKIANDFSMGYFKVEIGKRWNIFDLDSSIPLISRWLKKFRYEASFNPDLNSVGDIALVISNAAFSEMLRDLQEKYFKEIIIPARQGYFIENFDTFSGPLGGFTRIEFINRLKKAGKYVFELNANTWLSNYDKDTKTGLIVFSNKKISIPDRHLCIISKKEILFRQVLLFMPFLSKISFVKNILVSAKHYYEKTYKLYFKK